MAFDPVYPTYVNFHVSQEIWNLFEMYISQLVLQYTSKQRIFRYLRWRYEKNPHYIPALIVITFVYMASCILLTMNNWIQQRREIFTNYRDWSLMGLFRRLFTVGNQHAVPGEQQRNERVENDRPNGDRLANRAREQEINN